MTVLVALLSVAVLALAGALLYAQHRIVVLDRRCAQLQQRGVRDNAGVAFRDTGHRGGHSGGHRAGR